MVTRQLAVLALLLLPALASAQRRTRGDKSADWDAIERSTSSGPRFTNKDVERFSAIKVLVDKRKDLRLSDEQLNQLKAIDKREKEATKDIFITLDSLRSAMRSRPGVDAELERARTTIARQEAMRVIGEIRGAYDAMLKEALPLLDLSQQPAANAHVERERQEAEESLRQKLGGSAGRRDGGPAQRK